MGTAARLAVRDVVKSGRSGRLSPASHACHALHSVGNEKTSPYSMVLLSVNDNPNLAEEANVLHMEMTSKNLTSTVIQYSSGSDDGKYTS